MLQSSFGDLPKPILTGLCGDDLRNVFLGLIHRSLRNSSGCCHGKDGFTRYFLTVRKQIPNQVFGGSGLGFRIESAEQLVSGDVIVAIRHFIVEDVRTARRFLKKVDRDINIEADCVISPTTAGTVCVEMFYHFMGIAKEAYPVLMRAQWGG